MQNESTSALRHGPLGMHRRQSLTAGIASALCILGGSGSFGTVHEGNIFPRSFAGSRAISSFAAGLFFCQDKMPIALRRAIEAELSTSTASDSISDERLRAEFFAWLAVRSFAPLALRQAGYHQLASNCEAQSDLWNGMLAAATAQHTIGRDYRDGGTPRLAQFAYGASAHAATAAHYAGVDEIETVVQTGNYCARSLIESFAYDDRDASEAQSIWDVAVKTINTAIDIGKSTPG